MRWFVEISSLGQSPATPTTLCVDAPQWQPALQKARALRGDEGALTNFSIELLDDGYRAIDPTTRLKYVVRKAPDDAALTNGSAGQQAKAAVKIPNDPVPKAATPSFSVVSQREAKPTDKSPLTYREVVYAVSAGTTESQASALIHDRFEDVRASLAQAPAGRLVNLAVFDHVFQGKPLRPPLVTLTWKDWKGASPEVRFPSSDGPGNTPTQPLTTRASTPPAPASVPPAAASVPPTTASVPPAAASVPPTTASVPPAAASVPPAAASVPPATASAPPPTEPSTRPAPSAPPTTAPAPTAASAIAEQPVARLDSRPPPAPAPEPAPAPAPAPVATKSDKPPPSRSEPPARSTLPTGDSPPARAKKDSKPPVEIVSAPPTSKRLAGDELIAELFEAFSDLHFLSDSLAGAEFVLALAMEKLPSEVGLVSMFDINKREFVVVRQTGQGKSVLMSRLPEKAPLAQTAMRTHRAVVVGDAAADERVSSDERWKIIGVEVASLVCAPVMVGGRYLGLLELANPLDGDTFFDGDGHALTYIGEQFGEFVAQHGVVIDPEHVLAGSESASGGKPGKGARR